VETANVQLDFVVDETAPKAAIIGSKKRELSGDQYSPELRPWMKEEPREFKGRLGAPADSRQESSSKATIHIEMRVSRIPMPSGLSKLVTALTQVGTLATVGENGAANSDEGGAK
jgi:hypothetical protein